LKIGNQFDFSDLNLCNPPAEWWLKAFSATLLRREFDQRGRERLWFQLFQDVDKNGPIGFFKMSDFSRILLEHTFDYSAIKRKRIENYQILDHSLHRFSLFPELSDGVVPLGYPIILKNRDQVRQKLFEKNIYPPVHWPIGGFVPADYHESHELARSILTLICDQRYDASDMERMASIVLREAKG